MTIFQIIVMACLQVFFGELLFRKIRMHSISMFDWVFILSLDAALSMFLLYPSSMTYFSKIFHIGRGVDVFLYFGIFALFYIVLRLYNRTEKLREEITRLNRELSIRLSQEPGSPM